MGGDNAMKKVSPIIQCSMISSLGSRPKILFNNFPYFDRKSSLQMFIAGNEMTRSGFRCCNFHKDFKKIWFCQQNLF